MATTPRHDELQAELVDLFLAEGFRPFTLGELATRLRCSKTTLYALGESKEQLVANAVKRFFREATAKVELRAAEARGPAERVAAYLTGVAEELRAASPAFVADLAAHPAARAVYERNTSIAAERVRALVVDGVEQGAFRDVHASFVADTVASTMRRIQTGEVLRTTGLRDAEAYDELARLVLGGIAT